MRDAYERAVARARATEGPLAARLAQIRAAIAADSPDYAQAVDRFAARLAAAEVGRDAPAPGDPFPDFALPDQSGRIQVLAEFLARGPVVVAFQRGGWCGFCSATLGALAEAEPAIRHAGGQILALAPERAAFAERRRAGAGAAFPLLVDVGGGVATALGLTAALDDALAGLMRGLGIDLARINGDAGWTLPLPATFVIARDGRVAARHLDPDPRRRMEIDAILQAVAASASE